MNPIPRIASLATLHLVCGAAIAADPPWPTLAALDQLGRAIVAEGCARPQEVKSAFVGNPQRPDAADEMRSIDCRSHRIAIYVSHATEPARELPMELVVDRFHPRLDARIAVGASAAAVRTALGAPSATRGESFGYTLGKRDSLTFEVWSGQIRAVTWSWEID